MFEWIDGCVVCIDVDDLMRLFCSRLSGRGGAWLIESVERSGIGGCDSETTGVFADFFVQADIGRKVLFPRGP